jgi:hypothetical protein
VKKYQYAIWAVVLNILGFVSLAAAFHASSSDLKIVRTGTILAVCYADAALFEANVTGKYLAWKLLMRNDRPQR